jgi:hypothetical protein
MKRSFAWFGSSITSHCASAPANSTESILSSTTGPSATYSFGAPRALNPGSTLIRIAPQRPPIFGKWRCFCASCHCLIASRHLNQAQRTLDGNFQCNQYSKNNDPHDVSLAEGTGYLPEEKKYEAYVAKIPDSKEVGSSPLR